MLNTNWAPIIGTPEELQRLYKTGTICFTGPRPNSIYGYEDRSLYAPIVDLTTQVCRHLVHAGFTNFISGGAQGFDQLAFWAVNRIRKDNPSVKNLVYQPFQAQPDRWNQDGIFGQGEYRQMLAKASQVKTLYQDPPDQKAATRALMARNSDMIQDADFVIALLCGRSIQWPNAQGGTASCIRAARKKGRRILAIEWYPETATAAPVANVHWILP